MEELILKTLSADNEVIQQSTKQLREAFKNPENTRLMYQLIISSQNVEVRQSAAVLLRKRYLKRSNWTQLPENVRSEFKAVLSQVLMQEPDKFVQRYIVQLISTILKHELVKNTWPEMLQFVQDLLSDENANKKEMGLYMLSIMTEIAPDSYLPYLQTIMNLLFNVLSTCTDPNSSVVGYVLDILMNFVHLVEGNENMVNAYNQLIPTVINVVQSLALSNLDTAEKGIDLLQELCELSASVVSPHVKSLIELCLAIGCNKEIDDDMKEKAVLFVGTLAKMKKKAVVKNKFVEPIVDMLFMQMSSQPDDEEEEVYFSGDSENTPVTSATQTLDLLALHLPPDKLMPPLLKHIEPSLQGTEPYAKKAAFLSMAVLAEGCSEYIRSKYLEFFLRCIYQGITDSATVVRNAALFALGQFSEHLQPDISKFASDILPILFRFLQDMCNQIKQGNKELPSVDRMFYALEIFAENLNEALLPYLPTLMSILVEMLNSNVSVNITELALSAIGAACNASKHHMVPYLETVTNILNRYLLEKPNEETERLQIQAIDTLGTIARTIGPENFAPLALKSLEIGLGLLKDSGDPDLKKSVYGLLASISMVVKKDMANILPLILEPMLASVQSTEGIISSFQDSEGNSTEFAVYDNISENQSDEEDIENSENEDDDDDVDSTDYMIENAFIEEKEEAIIALKQIAEYTEEAFLPYLEKSFEEVYKIINYPQEDIRKAAIEAVMQFCINFSKIDNMEGKHALNKALLLYIPRLSEIIRMDEERTVVMEALEALTELIQEIGSEVLTGKGHKEAIMNCILEVMSGRTECQDQEEEPLEDEGEAEHDELLFEYAGELLTNFGKVISPEEFASYLQRVFPIFLKRLGNNNSDSQRSFSIGTMLECFPGLQHKLKAFIPELLPIFVKLTEDPCDEVRSNAIYGIGELAFHGEEIVYPQYLDILQLLSNLISKETHAGARDNIIGAIARLIITNYSIIPLDQVFPVFVSHLPLKEDLDENKTAFRSIILLYRNGETVIKPHVKHLFKVGLDILQNEKTDDETRGVVIEFMKSAQKDFVNEWNLFYSELPQDVAAKLQQI